MKVLLLNINFKGYLFNPIEEMVSLLGTLDYEIKSLLELKLKEIKKNTFLTKGLIEEVKELVKVDKYDLIVFNNDLSEQQYVNLKEAFGVPLCDRTEIIIKIFEMQSFSSEAIIETQLARLRYRALRLREYQEHYDQQRSGKGGINNRGQGEKEIELRRREIDKKIQTLNKRLVQVMKVRDMRRLKRENSQSFKIAIVGFTNAGKSTLLNRLLAISEQNSDKLVKEEDRLFATLNTAVRSIKFQDTPPILMTDTVGFISNISPVLFSSFYATFEEIMVADFLIHVIDGSSIDCMRKKAVTEDILKMFGVDDVPILEVYTKYDKLDNKENFHLDPGAIFVNLNDQKDVELIVETIKQRLFADYVNLKILVPYEKSDVVHRLRNEEYVIKCEEKEDGYLLNVKIKRGHLFHFKELF